MSASIETLFSPFHHGSPDLPSRIIMAPMARAMSPGGGPTPDEHNGEGLPENDILAAIDACGRAAATARAPTALD